LNWFGRQVYRSEGKGNSMTMCSPRATHETVTVILHRLNVLIDRLNVISSGSVVMKIDAKLCFPRDHLAAIFEVRLRTGRNVVEM
jgi:ABC-type hemin transport system ATPase subunit